MRLYLIRHAQTDSNLSQILDSAYPGAPLNPTGLAEAADLADRLGDQPITAVFSSDIVRAVQTATPLAERLGVPVRQLPGLREITGGAHEGEIGYAGFIADLAGWLTSPDARITGGESAAEFVSRYDAAIAEIAATGHRVVAVVSHGAALRVWTPLRAANMSVGSGDRYRLGNTAVIVLDGDPQTGWRVQSWAGERLDR